MKNSTATVQPLLNRILSKIVHGAEIVQKFVPEKRDTFRLNLKDGVTLEFAAEISYFSGKYRMFIFCNFSSDSNPESYGNFLKFVDSIKPRFKYEKNFFFAWNTLPNNEELADAIEMLRSYMSDLSTVCDLKLKVKSYSELLTLVTEPPTKTVFRKFKTGEIIALFPEIEQGPLYVSCYAHLGQHSIANYSWVISQTKAATEEQYAPLKAELENKIRYWIMPIKKYIKK